MPIERLAGDAELGAQLADLGARLAHGGLRQTELGRGHLNGRPPLRPRARSKPDRRGCARPTDGCGRGSPPITPARSAMPNSMPSTQGWINHVRPADSWGLRRHVLETLAIRPAEHRRAVEAR